MKFYRVSCTNCIIEADSDENARIGFLNYMDDIGIECLDVQVLTKKERDEIDDADWVA